MSLIGKVAPPAEGVAVINGNEFDENFSLADLQGNYVILFFYPLDFTFVCPTELHAFQKRLPEFEKRGCKVVGASVDSHFSHFAWLNTPKKQGGIQGVTYPLLSDITKNISRAFGVLDEESGVAFRGLFLLDKKGVVHHSLINDLPIGRSVDEALRTLDALIHFEEHGEVCPADWSSEKKAMTADQKGLETFFGE